MTAPFARSPLHSLRSPCSGPRALHHNARSPPPTASLSVRNFQGPKRIKSDELTKRLSSVHRPYQRQNFVTIRWPPLIVPPCRSQGKRSQKKNNEGICGQQQE